MNLNRLRCFIGLHDKRILYWDYGAPTANVPSGYRGFPG